MGCPSCGTDPWSRYDSRCSVSKVRVGMVGYFGFGNYGDELFREVFQERLTSADLEVVYDYNEAGGIAYESIASRVKNFDAVLIGGGDLVIPYALSSLYWREEYLEKPVFIFGVAVPKWGGYDESVVLKMRDFFQHENVKKIVARDLESQEWIAKHLMPKIEVEVEPDIVCAYEPRNEIPEPRTFGLVLRHQQAGLNNQAILNILETAKRYGYHRKVLMLGTGSTLRDDMGSLAKLDLGDVDVVIRSTEEALTSELLKCSRIASMKFHGCVVALTNNVPCLSLSAANKFKNFYSEIDRGEWVSTLIDTELVGKLEAVLVSPGFSYPAEIKKRSIASLAGLNAAIAATETHE